MDPRITIITLGVSDVARSIRFYRDGLGWRMSSASAGDFAIFALKTGTALALYPRRLLADDANIRDARGFSGITLAQNVKDRKTVDAVIAAARMAGARILRKPRDTAWGGYSGYFADPDGHPWEVAWAPQFRLRQGRLALPR